MRRRTSIAALVCALAPAELSAQPVLELPEAVTSTPAATATVAPAVPAPVEDGPLIELGTADVTDDVLTRGLRDARLNMGRTVLGSYGELALEYVGVGPDAPLEGTATVRRLVLFVAHNFSEQVRGYVELEWENALACSSCQGSVEVEQAIVDWKLSGDDLVLRGGLILVPMGIINQWHEPPVYHGVSRPRFDQLVIPTTWRELGAGVAGTAFDLARWELYLTTAPDALALGPSGLAQARTNGSFAQANSFMVSGRFEVEPILGFVVGVSGLAGDLGGGNRFFETTGAPRSLNLPLLGASADARWRRGGWELRLVGAVFGFPNAGDLLTARRADGSPHFPDPASSGVVPSRIWGAYVEVARDVLSFFVETDHQLLPFARVELYDTQAGVPDGFEPDRRFRVGEYTFGLSYRPIQQVVVKVDYQLRDRNLGFDEKQLDFGLGYMF